MEQATYNSPDTIDNDSPTLNATMTPLSSLQEMQSSFSSSTFHPVNTTFASIIMSILGAEFVVSMYVHYLVLKMCKRDPSLMNCLLPDMAWNVMVGGPIKFIIVCIVISLAEPAKVAIGIWFCHGASIIAYIWLFRIWIYSLLQSFLRYFYVVYNEKTREYGLTRTGTTFRILFWIVPATLVTLLLCLRTDYDANPVINQCYGWSSKFSSAGNSWNTVGRRFCAYNNYGFSSRYIEYGLRVVCGTTVGVCMLLFSNLAEAVIYYRIYEHLKTANDEGGDQFDNALSQRSREYRKRRQRISLHINMLGWLVESIGQWLLFSVVYMIFGGDDIQANMIIMPFYFLFQTILVPYSQLLNEARVKKLILRSGWFFAVRSVLNYNPNTVEPQPEDNIEMASLNSNDTRGNAPNNLGAGLSNGSGSSINPRGTARPSITEYCPGNFPNRTEINISWPQSYCCRPTTFSQEMRSTRRKVLRRRDRKYGSPSKVNPMHTIEEEDLSGKNEADHPSPNPDFVSSSTRKINQLGSQPTADSVLNIESTTENKVINLNAVAVVNDTKRSNLNPSSNVASCCSDMNIRNSDTSEPLRDELACTLERSAGITLVAEAPLAANHALTNVSYDDKEFQTFCRKELIHKLINLHCCSEIKYVQLFRCLLTLENELYMTTKSVCHDKDLFIALFNTWLLCKKKKKHSDKNNLEAQAYKLKEHLSQDFQKTQKHIARYHLLHKMLSNLANKWEYLKLLTNLYDVERDDLMTFDECAFLNYYL